MDLGLKRGIIDIWAVTLEAKFELATFAQTFTGLIVGVVHIQSRENPGDIQFAIKLQF